MTLFLIPRTSASCLRQSFAQLILGWLSPKLYIVVKNRQKKKRLNCAYGQFAEKCFCSIIFTLLFVVQRCVFRMNDKITFDSYTLLSGVVNLLREHKTEKSKPFCVMAVEAPPGENVMYCFTGNRVEEYAFFSTMVSAIAIRSRKDGMPRIVCEAMLKRIMTKALNEEFGEESR